MDKSWMKKSRSSRDYLQGVKDFLNFASVNASKDGTISCPCVKCVNSYILKTSVVHDHLVQFGISQGYDCWYNHGETMSAATCSNTCQTHVEDMQLDNDSIRVMLRDVFPSHTQSVDEIGDAEYVTEPSNEGPSGQQRTQVPNKNAQKFYDLLKDAEQPFYEGCTNHSKLSAILHLYHIKCLKGLTNDMFTLILQVSKSWLGSLVFRFKILLVAS